MKSVAIIIPTYNEAENIEKLIPKIFSVFKKNKINGNVVVIDDNSPDGTADIVKRLMKKYKVSLIERESKQGLGSAYMEGFEKIRDKNDIIFQMDADFSHKPEHIPNFIEKIEEGYDVVIGSRYVKGGKRKDPIHRRILPFIGNSIYHMKFKVKDVTSGYRAYRTDILKKLDKEHPKDFSFQASSLYNLLSKGAKVTEIPIDFKERRYGEPKYSNVDLFSNMILLFKIILRPHLFAILGYTILTLILTYPLILHLADKIPGHSDAWYNLWNIWWFKQSLFSADISLFFTNYLFYPMGVSLIFNDFAYSILVPSIIFSNSILYYNLWILFGFIASGYTMFLLADYLTKDKTAAFIAGIIFTFSADHFIHALGHLNNVSMQWMPLYILFLIKTIREKTITNAIFAALFLILVALTSWYYLAYMILFTAFLLLYQIKSDYKTILNKDAIKKLSVILIIFSLVILPVLYPKISSGEEQYLNSQSIFFSADLLSFFTPSPQHPIFGQYTKNIYNNFTGSLLDNVNYIGFTILLLAVFSVFRFKIKRFWIWSALIFFILALGPILHLNGNMLIPFGGVGLGNFAEKAGYELPDKKYEFLDNQTPYEALNDNIVIPLPYLLLKQVPYFEIFRTPARFAVLMMLSLSILCAYGLKEMFRRTKGRYYGICKKHVFAVAISSFIIFESLVIPLQMSDARIPEFYSRLSHDKEDYALMEVPFKAKSMYYQTVHNKKIVYGLVSYVPSKSREFIENNSLAYELDINFIESSNFELSFTEDDLKGLKENNVRYIIIHKNSLEQEKFDLINNRLLEIIGDEPMIYNDYEYDSKSENNFMYVYEVV